MKLSYEELEAKCLALAAENAGLKASGNKMFLSAVSLMEDPELKIDHARDIKDWERIKTPATDAFLAEVRASARKDFIDRIEWIIRNECNPEKTETILNELRSFSETVSQEVAQ